MTDSKDFEDKVVLITGASRGIGYAAALEVARRGGHVVAVARTVGGLEELDDAIQAFGGASTLVPMDLADGAAIDRLGGAIHKRWGRLDGLVGNAGALGVLSPVPHFSPEEFDKVMAINVTANFRLLRSMDVLLRQSEAGRVLFVSSNIARACRPYWGLYASTKAALDALAKTYAAEMSNTAVKVNVLYPGATRTAMRAKAMPGEDAKKLPHPDEVAPKLVDMISGSFGQTGMVYNRADDSLQAL